MRRLSLLSAALAAAVNLAGCGAAPPTRFEIQQVKVPVPVPCDEPEPERPNMPTEHLPADADVDMYVQAAGAEIERWNGYEIELRAALANCKRPLNAVEK
ncbi:hypothetical protein P245_15150 [Comamonas thiooxydans]|uniref:Lipoprotein n=1 Tax=Comamonas thiooxydans TaxID=363952 RepID=A0A0E3BCN7_9BURK|nr:hypothetical protein [Comamonas thiooxydans]KGG90662.1 hypothetical protein P245_15150 [Comamonas thiooxydans]